MAVSDLLRTDIYLAALLGERDEREDFFVVRTPGNPGFFYGNLLVLKQEPKSIEHWLKTFEAEFGAETGHRCLAWNGPDLGPELVAEAKRLRLDFEDSAEMFMESAPQEVGEWRVRPLDLETEWESIVELNIASDVTEQKSDDSYRLFKSRLRERYRQWLERGLATWWGAFDGERLVGQCGMVPCEELGRFQSVETHPDYRRRGVCASLISVVARHGLEKEGFERLMLVAEVDGPALELYKRLGFVESGKTQSLLRHDRPINIRPEEHGDHASTRSLVIAAFKGSDEAHLIEGLREAPDTISLVAEQTNSLMGHVLFSRVQIEGVGAGTSVAALAPLAVRPSAEGRGFGSLLVRKGLELCQQAGFELCLVIGSPDYYARFGFVPATPHGLSNPFGVTDEHFMVLELKPGALAGCSGQAIYHEAFAAL